MRDSLWFIVLVIQSAIILADNHNALTIASLWAPVFAVSAWPLLLIPFLSEYLSDNY